MSKEQNNSDRDVTADSAARNRASVLMGHIVNALVNTKVLDPRIQLPRTQEITLALGPGVVKQLRKLIKDLMDLLQMVAGRPGTDGPGALHLLFLGDRDARDFCFQMQLERERQEALYTDKNRQHRLGDWRRLISDQIQHLAREGVSFDPSTPNNAAGERCAHELYSIAALAQAAYEYVIIKRLAEPLPNENMEAKQ